MAAKKTRGARKAHKEKDPLEKGFEHFSEEVEHLGKKLEKRFDGGDGCDTWFCRTFGVVGPLISSVFGLLIFGLVIWLIGIVNFSGSMFLESIRSFLMNNIGVFFLFFLFFSYGSYFSKTSPRPYAPFSPLVAAVGVAIIAWLLGNALWLAGPYAGFPASVLATFLLGNTFQIFAIVLVIAYAVFFVRVSLGMPPKAERLVMRRPAPVHSGKQPQVKRLYRSGNDRILGGVCGGIAEYLGVDPVIIRLLWVISIFAWGFGILAYIIAWIIIPRNPEHKWKK